ncbi:MAG: hypothetical protein IIB33_06690, partial [Chloroflexi bacterium]|nr:hypothetical protein [Chloroflexota bacterium]
MNNRPFILLVVAVLVLGGGLGGAFAGGVAVGKGQEEVAPTNTILQPPSDPGQITQERLEQFRQQFQGQFGGGGGFRGGDGFGGRGGLGGGLTGTIESIDGAVITLDTAQGLLIATLNADTTIQMFVEGTPTDLEPGMQVSVIGQRADDGTV